MDIHGGGGGGQKYGITLAVINHFKMSLRSQNGKPLSNICTAERDRERGSALELCITLLGRGWDEGCCGVEQTERKGCLHWRRAHNDG